jgi:hypothetical protein
MLLPCSRSSSKAPAAQGRQIPCERGQLAAAVAPGVALCVERKPQAPAVFRSNSLQPASYSTSEGVVPCYALMPLSRVHRAQAELRQPDPQHRGSCFDSASHSCQTAARGHRPACERVFPHIITCLQAAVGQLYTAVYRIQLHTLSKCCCLLLGYLHFAGTTTAPSCLHTCPCQQAPTATAIDARKLLHCQWHQLLDCEGTLQSRSHGWLLLPSLL